MSGDELWRRADGGFTQEIGCVLACWDIACRPRGYELRVVLGREGGRLVAAWPVMVHRVGRWCVGRQIGPMAAESSEVLVEPGPRAQERADAVVDAVLSSRPLDVLSGTFVRAGGGLDRALRRTGRMHTLTADVSPVARLRGAGDWGGFHASLSAAQRKTDRKRRRRLEARGVVTVEVLHSGDPAAPVVLDWLLDHKQRWGERVGKNGSWLVDPAYRALWRELVGVPGRLPVQVFVLRLDGAPVAAQVAVVGSRHLDLVIAGFDENHQDVSPGSALSAEVVRWALDHDLDVEFGNGSEPYKLFWCRGETVTTRTVSLPVTRWGALGLAAQRQVTRVRDRGTTPSVTASA